VSPERRRDGAAGRVEELQQGQHRPARDVVQQHSLDGRPAFLLHPETTFMDL